MTPDEAVALWRDFARNTRVTHRGHERSWAEHIAGRGYADEESLIQPVVFPEFANQLLDFQIGVNLAAEESAASGKPDFTPADAVTHPFVFETKSTSDGAALTGHINQVTNYLHGSRERIRRVVLTNLLGLKVFELDPETEEPVELVAVDLGQLLFGTVDAAATTASGENLAQFLEEFRRHDLTVEQKLDRARQAPPWVPTFEITDLAGYRNVSIESCLCSHAK